MKLVDLVYLAWQDVSVESIEKEIEGLMDESDINKADVDTMVNMMFNVTDMYEESSRDWIENVQEIVRKYEV